MNIEEKLKIAEALEDLKVDILKQDFLPHQRETMKQFLKYQKD